MSKRMDHVLSEAVALGLVRAADATVGSKTHPWPVIAITGLLTLLASLPMCGLMLFLIFDNGRGWLPVAVGSVALAGSIAMLRIRRPKLFVECFAAALLTSGLVLMYFHPYQIRSEAPLGIIALVLTLTIPQPWVRGLLAASAVYLLGTALPELAYSIGWFIPLPAWYGSVTMWLFGHVALHRAERAGRYDLAAVVESVLIGAGLAILAMLVYTAGPTFLIGGLEYYGHLMHASWDRSWEMYLLWPMAIPASAVIVAGVWAWKRMATPNKTWLFIAVPAIALLSCFSWPLGAIVLMATTSLIWQRTLHATLSGLGGLWAIGSLYYSFDWPLMHKALVLFGTAGVLLLSTSLIDIRARDKVATPCVVEHPVHPKTKWGLIVPAVVAVLMTNVSIWKNEHVVRQGTTLFVELIPVDPRSMMQGDYMTLTFALPQDVRLQSSPSAFAVVQRSDNGIATVTRMDDGTAALMPNELRIQVVRRGGHTVLATDAWYFKEGEGNRWSRAKYGEFRVDAKGHAVLVNLRGPNLESL